MQWGMQILTRFFVLTIAEWWCNIFMSYPEMILKCTLLKFHFAVHDFNSLIAKKFMHFADFSYIDKNGWLKYIWKLYVVDVGLVALYNDL